MLLRIRDFFKINDKIFSTTDYSLSKESIVKCLLRYTEDKDGDRRIGEESYKKVSFDESFKLLKDTKYVDEDKKIQSVNKKDIDKVFKPNKGLKNNSISKKVAEFFSKKISNKYLGITGSRLLGLEKEESDIDFVVYGSSNFKKARNLLKKYIKNNKLSGLSERDWKKAYKKRNPPISFKTYLIHSERKWNKAKYNRKKLDLLFARSRKELPQPKFRGKILDDVREIEAKVTNDDFAFDSPAVYGISHPDFSKVISFTHTYAGQVFEGEKLVARGKKINNKPILVSGSVREPKKDYIISKDIN